MAFCRNCGQHVDDTDMFCAACGTAQTITEHMGPTSESDSQNPSMDFTTGTRHQPPASDFTYLHFKPKHQPTTRRPADAWIVMFFVMAAIGAGCWLFLTPSGKSLWKEASQEASAPTLNEASQNHEPAASVTTAAAASATEQSGHTPTLPTKADASVDHCRNIVPVDAIETIASILPAYRMPESSDNLVEDVEYNISRKGTGCPGIARGDFDGDGNQDYLIGLSSITGSGTAIVVALSHKPGWTVERLDEWPEGRSSLYVDTGDPGTYGRTEALDGPPEEMGEVMTLTCEHNAAIFGTIESSGVAYCLQQSQWLHVWISD